jgi:hypothetical protein
MNWIVARLCFIILFIAAFCGLSFVALMMAISTGLGPRDAGDPPVTKAQELMSSVGGGLLTVMWFPINIIKKAFFEGQPLPGGDLPWIAGCGLLYSIIILSMYDVIRVWRKKRRTNASI